MIRAHDRNPRSEAVIGTLDLTPKSDGPEPMIGAHDRRPESEPMIGAHDRRPDKTAERSWSVLLRVFWRAFNVFGVLGIVSESGFRLLEPFWSILGPPGSIPKP